MIKRLVGYLLVEIKMQPSEIENMPLSRLGFYLSAIEMWNKEAHG